MTEVKYDLGNRHEISVWYDEHNQAKITRECFEALIEKADFKEHDKQLLEDLNEFLVEEKGEYVGSDIDEFLAIRKEQENE